ncbi:phosphatase PAP2 family protein [Niabella terrae]
MPASLYIALPDWLVKADRWLFELINVKSALPLLDTLLPALRNAFFWGPLYLFIVAFVIRNFKKNGWWWLALVLATVACTDIVGARIFKESFERLRPCNDPEMIGHIRMVLGRCSGGFSFVSNHAINHFGIAAFVFITFRPFFKQAGWLFVWAAVISLAQIYVGVHYPFDVLAGTLLGLLIGTLGGKLFNKRFGFLIFGKQSIDSQ